MKWVLFDVSWLAHRARHSLKGLSHGDVATGVIFGFFEQLRTICFDRRVLSNQVALCFDSGSSYRQEACPQYKSGRAKDRTEEDLEELRIMHEQIRLLRKKILPEIGFPIYRQDGLESDDIMAQAALQIKTECVMVTADGDLYQCISNTASWFNPMKDLWLDPGSFLAKKGVSPNDWARVKCLAGCMGDNVDGIPGIGEKSAVDYLLHLLPKHHKRYKDIEANLHIAESNRALVELPHARTQDIMLEAPEYNAEAFFKWCEKLGLESFLGKGRRVMWERFLAGDMNPNRQVARRPKQMEMFDDA